MTPICRRPSTRSSPAWWRSTRRNVSKTTIRSPMPYIRSRTELTGGGKLSASASGPKTIFIVEGNAKFQDAFREKLKARGYRVFISINAAQAVARFQEQPYDALIVNCGTADRAGLDAYEKVMQEADLKRQECAGIVILSREQAHWQERSRLFPKSAVLILPVGIKQIMQKLDEFIPREKGAKAED